MHRTPNDDPSGLPARQALQRLTDGHARFLAGRSTPPDLSAARRCELATGQKPFAVVLTCSDSRLAPEHIFNAGLGELFVIRNAGNVADIAAVAGAEYAASHLGTPLVMVLGHTACGAIKAAVTAARDTPALEAHLAQLAAAVALARQENLTGDALVQRAAALHAMGTRESLLRQSVLLTRLEQKGQLKVLAALYDLADGQLRWLQRDGL